MSSSPFPYTCELCGAEGLTDEGMRSHTLEAHVAGRPDCPFCDCAVPQTQLVGHVQKAHLHYLTPERELMAFIDDQSPSFEDDSKMTTTDSCSYNTPGSVNGWHSPDTSSSYHNGAISKNYHNGYCDNFREEERRSPKCNGVKNVTNGVIPKKLYKQNSNDGEAMNDVEKRGNYSRHSHKNRSYEGSPEKNKLPVASAGQGSPLRSQLALKLKPNTPKKLPPTPSPTVQCFLCEFTSTCPRKLEEHLNRAHFDLTSPSVIANANSNANTTDNPTLGLNNSTLGLNNPTLTLDNATIGFSAMSLSPEPQCSSFQCPICEKEFNKSTELEIHVNVEHKDILSPQKADQVDNASCDDVVMMEESPVSNCPVCCQPLPLSQHELIQHIEEHFERGEDSASALSDAEREAQKNREEHEFQLLRRGEDSASALSDAEREAQKNREEHEFQLLRRGEDSASALSDAEREAQKNREEHEFQLLRAQYGMDEDGEGYTNRATNSLKRAVYSGALSVAGYYERSVGLKKASVSGTDAGESRTGGILERIVHINSQNPSILKTYLCSAADHYASTYGDRGWGCGYRNMQMVLSSLLRNPQYVSLLESVSSKDGDCVPSIPRLQKMVETAWQMGFDTQGSEQLGCKLYNTRKWIGACEVVTVLSSLRIRCQLIDFHKPTSADGSHPALFDWVLRYFQNDPNGFKAPLYLQHQGHSRTIIGYERHKDGKATLLVLDPSHSPAQVRQIFCNSTTAFTSAIRLLRRSSSALRARQYQLLCITGTIANDHEYEASKVLQSVRIP